MTTIKTTMACLLGLSLAACTEAPQADPAKQTVPARSATNLTTTKLELGRVP